MKAVSMKTLFLLLLSCIAISESPKILCNSKLIEYEAKESTIFHNQFNVGIKFKEEGNFSKALEHFQLAKKTAHNEGNIKAEVSVLYEIGLMNWNLARMDESLQIFEQLLQIASNRKLDSCIHLAEKAISIHHLYAHAKELRDDTIDYPESIRTFKEAIQIADEITSSEFKVKLLRQLSIVYDEQNMAKEYKELTEEALAISLAINHSLESMRCLNNIGTYYDDIGNYSEALLTYEEASKYANEANRKSTASDIKNNISIIYKKLGEFDKAIDFLEDVLVIDRSIGDNLRISMALNNLGETYRRRGLADVNEKDFEMALDYFKQALALAEKLDNKDARETEVRVHNNIGTVYADRQQHVESLSHFNRGLKLAEIIKDQESIGMINTNLGIVHYNQGNFVESTKYFQKAIDFALNINDQKTLWEAYLELAKSYVKQERYKDALKSLEESILIIENIRSNIFLEELKASFLGTDKRIEAYHDMINLLIMLDKLNPSIEYKTRAFEFLERAKARAFLDELETSQINISQNVDFILQNKKTEVEKDITDILTRQYESGQSSDDIEKLHEELKGKEYELENVKREIRSKSPAYANLFHPEIIKLDEVQNNLCTPDTTFVEFSVGKQNSYAFFISKKNLKIIELPPREHIQNLVSNYLKILSDRDNDNFSLGHELYKILLEPGINQNIKNLIIISDDILNYLPFETLLSDLETRRWLIQDFRIAYVPSITALNEIIQRKKEKGTNPNFDILAFGDPYYGVQENEPDGNNNQNGIGLGNGLGLKRLKHSHQEIERISQLFNEAKIKTYTRSDASEEKLKSNNLNDFKIIHFATHSMIDNNRPDRSYIALSNEEDDEEEDGLLYTSEIFNLSFNADLVTLSACQTGLGKLIRGEGIEGINRAFFYAGTSSVLMSLWPVNDQATSQLMERFYAHMNRKNSIMDSLREAKLELIESEALSHPYYWAGFIVSGKADHIIFPEKLSLGMLFGITIIAAILLLIFLKARKFKLSAGKSN